LQEQDSKIQELKKGSEKELHLVMHEAKEIIEALVAKEKNQIKRFKIHHKIIFAFVVFFGINLLWYGMWTLVDDTPILHNPFIALISGAIILIVTGYFYENLISSNFGRRYKPRAKKKT
jgi:hypothetical protein